MSFRGLLIPVDIAEPARPVQYDDCIDIQDAVKGLFDVVRVEMRTKQYGTVEISLWVNDEGLIMQLPVNMRASGLFKKHLVGPVMVSGAADYAGETTDCPEWLIDAFLCAELEHNVFAQVGDRDVD